MEGKDLFKAIGSIGEQHVEDTLQYFRMRRRMQFVKIGSAAAALCLVVTGAVFFALHKTPAKSDPPVAIHENGFLIRDGELIEYSGSDTDVVIPETVDAIANGAFAGAKDISTVTLTANVKRVGYEAFNGEKEIRLLLSEDNRYFKKTEDAIISDDGTVFLQYVGGETEKYVIPKGVQQIGAFAFYEAQIDEVIFPDGLQSIGKGAFSGCALREIALPDSVKRIGMQAFFQCIYAIDGSVPDDAKVGEDAFFRVPFYTSLLAGHPCPGEDIQRGTITPSKAIVQSKHLQDINDAVFSYITTGRMTWYDVEISDVYYTDWTQKVDIRSAVFIDGTWGKNIECRANIYITDDQYVSIGLACINGYDCDNWKEAEWSVRRAEFYPETFSVQDEDETISVLFERDEETMNRILTGAEYNGRKYEIQMKEQAAFVGSIFSRDLVKAGDGIYILSWLTCENAFDVWVYNYGNTARGILQYTYAQAPTLTVFDFRSGNLHVRNYFDTFEGYPFYIGDSIMYTDGMYKLALTDYNYLSIDWVEYLDNKGGVALHEFEKIVIDDIAELDRLKPTNDYLADRHQRKVDLLRAFIEKNTAALEEKSSMNEEYPSGIYDLYKTLEFGEYTITQIVSDWDLYYRGYDIILDIDILQSGIEEIPVGRHRFTVQETPRGFYVMQLDRNTVFSFNHTDLWELHNFMGEQRIWATGDMEIPDLADIKEEELHSYKRAVILYLLNNKCTYSNGSTEIEQIVSLGKELFGLVLTKEDIENVGDVSYVTILGDQIQVSGHGGAVSSMSILDRIDWGDTITVTVRYYAEGSLTIPAKDVRYTLTKTPYGLAFLTPSETVQDYGRPIWGYSV